MNAPKIIEAGGRLAMTPATLFALAAVATGDRSSSPSVIDHLDTLRDAGLLDGWRVRPDVEPIARAIHEARCDITVELDADRLIGWVSPDRLVLLAPGDDPDGRVDVLAGPTSYLPVLLLDLVRLVPLPSERVGAAVTLPCDELPALLSSDPAAMRADDGTVGETDRRTSDALAHLVETYYSRFAVEVRWGPDSGRRVEGLASDGGWWWVERDVPEMGLCTLAATTATVLYRGLTALLPSEAELTGFATSR